MQESPLLPDYGRRSWGAQILNGDRCVVMEKEDGFYGGGSPLAGTSGIYRREQAPIAAIFLPEKADHCQVTPLGLSALAPMLGQTLINSWDGEFMSRLMLLYQQLLDQVPVYRYACTPDQAAVDLSYLTAFFGGYTAATFSSYRKEAACFYQEFV